MVEPYSTDQRIITRKMILDVETHKPWTDKLGFISIEIPRFTKLLSECNTLLDKWFYVLRNLHRLMEKPPEFQEEIFAPLEHNSLPYAARHSGFDTSVGIVEQDFDGAEHTGTVYHRGNEIHFSLARAAGLSAIEFQGKFHALF